MEEERNERHDGGVSCELPEGQHGKWVGGFGGQVLLFCVWHKRDVFLEMVGVSVVGLVREEPGVVEV